MPSLNAQLPDPRGPIAAYPGQIQVNGEGVSLTTAAGSLISPKVKVQSAKWTPNWIAVASPESTSPLVSRFRTEITIQPGQPIKRAIARVSADRFYRLWINGLLVSRGPDDPGSDYSPHDRWSHQWLSNRVDVTSYLHAGVNVIAAEVFRLHREEYSLGTTAFAFDLSMESLSGSRHALTESGHGWMAKDSSAYTQQSIAALSGINKQSGWRYDATLDDPAWLLPGFTATRWSPARIIPSKWGPVAESQLPAMMEAVWPIMQVSTLDGSRLSTESGTMETLAPDKPTPEFSKGNGRFLVRYDRVLSAYISLKLQGSPGTRVTIWPSESIEGDQGRRPFQVVLGQGSVMFESPTLESFSAIEIEVSHATEPVKFNDIRASFVSQPVVYRGSFTSNDETLNALWKAARWQTQLCLQNRFLDSPDHQEPIGDPGDYLIEAKVADDAFGAVPMTPQFLREFAAILDHWMMDHPTGSPNFHTSYSLLWLQTLMEYYEETGDVTLPKELAPTAYRLLARYAQWIGSNGILSEAPNYLFMDWVTIGGFNTHHPPAVIGQGYLTAFFYRGLQDGIQLAHLTGDTRRASEFTRLRTSIRKAFNQELWDAKVGLYRDGRPFLNHNPTSPDFLPADRDIETHSPHVNALAVLYDLAPQKEQSQILARIMGPDRVDPANDLNVQPYFMHFILAAEAHAGVMELYARAQLARWKVNPQTQTFQEMWNRGDWSHGWGGTPLIQMSSHVLGVSPRVPGYSTVSLHPLPLGLTSAKGTVPTPKGDVSVSWSHTEASFIYETILPKGTRALLNLDGVPGVHSKYLSIDGSTKKLYSRSICLTAGDHKIVLQDADR